MARRLTVAPEVRQALDLLTKEYGGSNPAQVEFYVQRSAAEGGPARVTNPDSPTGRFDVPISELTDDRLENWILTNPHLGGGRSYRVLVYMPKADGTYPPRPSRSFPITYVDPETAAAEIQKAQVASQVAATNDAATGVAEAAAKLVTEAAAKSPENADKLYDVLAGFTATLGNTMSQINRFGTTPLGAVAQQQTQIPQYPPAPYGYPPFNPYMMPMAPPTGGNDKLADALVALVTAKPNAPATDPAVMQMLQQQGQVLAAIAQKLAAPAAPSGPSPELLAIQARLEAAERAAADAKRQAEIAAIKAESDRKELEFKAQLAELTRKLEGGAAAKPDAAFEMMKLQLASQEAAAKQHADLMRQMQEQANQFNREIREILSDPGPDQSQQMRQMATAMSEVTNTMMGMAAQAVRMGGGGGGGDDRKEPLWVAPVMSAINMLGGAAASMMAPPPAPPQGAPAPEAPLPMDTTLALPAHAPAPAPQNDANEAITRARQLAQGSDFIGAIRTLENAMTAHPEIVQGGDKIATIAALLDGIQWPVNTSAEAVEGAYVAVYGDAVREHLAKLVQKERAKQGAQPPAVRVVREDENESADEESA